MRGLTYCGHDQYGAKNRLHQWRAIADYCIQKFSKMPWKNQPESHEYTWAESGIVSYFDMTDKALTGNPEFRRRYMISIISTILEAKELALYNDKALPF